MATATTLPQQPDLGDAYEDVYNVLKKMYWEASTLEAKDEVHGVLEEVGDIIDQIDQQGLEDNTAIFIGLQPKIAVANAALQKIQARIDQITKNIGTAATALAAIGKVLSLIPKPL